MICDQPLIHQLVPMQPMQPMQPAPQSANGIQYGPQDFGGELKGWAAGPCFEHVHPIPIGEWPITPGFGMLLGESQSLAVVV